MWQASQRAEMWNQLNRPWDIIVIGGGITGAGILREATRLGFTGLLLEQRDFSWGTSSRSSKLIHGGLRYLKEGRLRLTRASVKERERLLKEGPGLVEPLGFLLATYKGDFPGRWSYELALAIYDVLAMKWDHRYYDPWDFQMLAAHIAHEGLKGGFRYVDAQTDDARLVLRVIREAAAEGAVPLNYVRAEELVRERGHVVGVRARDGVHNKTTEIPAKVVVNATGPWADRLRGSTAGRSRVRPLRGSHLVFPGWRLPVAQAIGFLHPLDRRPVFVLPWEGATILGTTDVDHEMPLDMEPRISAEEAGYLMTAVQRRFPSLGLTQADVVSTFAGVRPVVTGGRGAPSKASREHAVWEENGLLTVTGGKLTTFRLIALDALKALRHRLPFASPPDDDMRVFNPLKTNLVEEGRLSQQVRRRLLGRYAGEAVALIGAAGPEELETIPDTPILWAELRWAARTEAVVHLDDLLLRRVRLGLLIPEGGARLLPRIRAICQPELGWDDARWAAEESAYRDLWKKCYSFPDKTGTMDVVHNH